jgi:hypothetical protein
MIKPQSTAATIKTLSEVVLCVRVIRVRELVLLPLTDGDNSGSIAVTQTGAIKCHSRIELVVKPETALISDGGDS